MKRIFPMFQKRNQKSILLDRIILKLSFPLLAIYLKLNIYKVKSKGGQEHLLY